MTAKQAVSQAPLHEVTLVERAANCDREAIAALYDLYAPKIYSYIYHRLSDPTLAEDLTAQVFLRMIEALQAGKGWQSSFSGWLYRIAHNLVIDHYRKRSQATFTDIDDSPHLPASDSDPFRTATLNLANGELARAINGLTQEQAQVIVLRFIDGYSIAEVALMLDKTEGAIKALQYRAVASLRRLLGEEAP